MREKRACAWLCPTPCSPPAGQRITRGQPGGGVEATGRCRKPLWAMDGTLWRPRSPAERQTAVNGGELGGRRWVQGGRAETGFLLVVEGAKPLHLLRRSRICRHAVASTTPQAHLPRSGNKQSAPQAHRPPSSEASPLSPPYNSAAHGNHRNWVRGTDNRPPVRTAGDRKTFSSAGYARCGRPAPGSGG